MSLPKILSITTAALLVVAGGVYWGWGKSSIPDYISDISHSDISDTPLVVSSSEQLLGTSSSSEDSFDLSNLPPVEEWEEYVNEEVGFSFRYPVHIENQKQAEDLHSKKLDFVNPNIVLWEQLPIIITDDRIDTIIVDVELYSHSLPVQEEPSWNNGFAMKEQQLLQAKIALEKGSDIKFLSNHPGLISGPVFFYRTIRGIPIGTYIVYNEEGGDFAFLTEFFVKQGRVLLYHWLNYVPEKSSISINMSSSEKEQVISKIMTDLKKQYDNGSLIPEIQKNVNLVDTIVQTIIVYSSKNSD